MDNARFEETTAELLGQIQASVAEFVRSLNEAGALRRREADEAHRQHDQALRSLAALDARCKSLLAVHTELIEEIQVKWESKIVEGATEVAIAQARTYADAVMTTIDKRAEAYAKSLGQLIASTEAVTHRAVSENRLLTWKTVLIHAIWGSVISILVVTGSWLMVQKEIRASVAQISAVAKR